CEHAEKRRLPRPFRARKGEETPAADGAADGGEEPLGPKGLHKVAGGGNWVNNAPARENRGAPAKRPTRPLPGTPSRVWDGSVTKANRFVHRFPWRSPRAGRRLLAGVRALHGAGTEGRRPRAGGGSLLRARPYRNRAHPARPVARRGRPGGACADDA